jgi:tagatose 6-phosphate kinase
MIRVQDGVETVPVWVSAPSREIVTILDTSNHVQTAYMEPGPELTSEEAARVGRVFENVLNEARVVTFNGTVPCAGLNSLYYDLIKVAASRGIKTVLDSHGPAFAEGIKAQPFMVKPNVEEAERFLGERLGSDKDVLKAIRKYHRLGVEWVVISMGARGAIASLNGHVLKCTPPRIEEVNPVGSGDALVAGFAVGLMEEMDIEGTCRLAVGAGTANATSWEIGRCSRAEMARYAALVKIARL